MIVKPLDIIPYLADDIRQGSELRSMSRPKTAERGYGGKWQQARKAYLRKHPFCARCLKQAKLTPASVVDHITPHKGNNQLFWDSTNWQSLCTSCHSGAKQMAERTGTGYRKDIGHDGWPTDKDHPINRLRSPPSD